MLDVLEVVKETRLRCFGRDSEYFGRDAQGGTNRQSV